MNVRQVSKTTVNTTVNSGTQSIAVQKLIDRQKLRQVRLNSRFENVNKVS